MNYKLASIGLALVLLPILGAMGKTTGDIHYISRSLNNFSMEVFNKLADTEHANFISSPLSFYTLFSMMYIGSGRNTLQKMESALHLDSFRDRSLYFQGMKDLIKRLKIHGGTELNLTNSIYFNERMEIKQIWQRGLKYYYEAPAKSISFSEKENAFSLINNWIEQRTNNKVMNLLPSKRFPNNFDLLFLDIMSFKGTWKNKFMPFPTIGFKVQGELKYTPAVYAKANFAYRDIENLGAEAIEIPYKTDNGNDEISMTIVFPHQTSSLNDVKTKLEKHGLPIFNNQDKKQQVEIRLPKLEFDSTADIKPALKKLNITDIISEIDFSRSITPKTYSMFLISKTAVDFDYMESGDVCFSDFQPAPITITIDRPFFVFIRTQNVILFTGQFVKPPKNHSKTSGSVPTAATNKKPEPEEENDDVDPDFPED